MTSAYHSLTYRMNRFDTLGSIYNTPKSVREGIVSPRHTPAAYEYTTVGVTSVIVFDRLLIVVVQVTKNKAYSVAYSAM